MTQQEEPSELAQLVHAEAVARRAVHEYEDRATAGIDDFDPDRHAALVRAWNTATAERLLADESLRA